MDEHPEWLRLGESIMGPLLADTSQSLKAFSGGDFHVTQLPTLALYHLAPSNQPEEADGGTSLSFVDTSTSYGP